MYQPLQPTTNNLNNETAEADEKIFTTRSVSRISLKDWGFTEAGVNRGNTTAFENKLRLIKAGHIVDNTYDAEEENKRKNQLEAQVLEKEQANITEEANQLHLKNVKLPDVERQIKTEETNIIKKQKEIAEGTIKSKYSSARFLAYTILASLIAVFLVLFYASAINASFFRNIQQMVASNSADDVALMLNSIFDAKGIFTPNIHLIFVYFGAAVFFGFGLLPHIFNDDEKLKWLKITAAVIVCLLIDCLLAYKIDSSIHELKLMMGVADTSWVWYKSVNFYMVLSFGFGTYILCGFLYEAAIKEHEKKNVNAIAEIDIKGYKNTIEALQKEVIELKKELSNSIAKVAATKLEIEKLKKEIEVALLKPETLQRNMENFYSGWLKYLTQTPDHADKIQDCENIYRTFNTPIDASIAAMPTTTNLLN